MSTNSGYLPSRLNALSLPIWQWFTVLALLVMDLSWITPAYTLLAGKSLGGYPGRVFIVLGVIYLVTSLVANWRHFFDINIGIIQTMLLAILSIGLIWATNELLYFTERLRYVEIIGRYLSSFTSFPVPLKPELLLTITVFYLWRRSLAIARHPVGIRSIRQAFKLGIIALVAIGTITASLGRSLPTLEAVLFLFSGLMAMGAARLSSLSRLRGGRGIPFEREWVVGLILLTIGFLVIAGGLGLLAAGPISVWVGGLLSVVWRFVLPLLKIILWPIIYFFRIVLGWILGLIETPQEEVVDPTAIDGLEEGMSGLVTEIQAVGFGPQMASFIATIVTVIGVVFLIWIVLYTVRKFKSESLARIPEEDERVPLSGSISDYLRALLQGRAKRAIEGISRLNPAARFFAAARIRRIYASLLRLSASFGEPRSPSETPLEFMDNLERIFPASQVELATITHAYLRVRYGELPETSGQVEEVEAAWELVRKRGRPDEETG
ncbi:MAG: DUF4129 domain-containing protein [Anaerolineales bacterium]|nr:DUF4129 domain-containing protein [Anaerolineales bacterium]